MYAKMSDAFEFLYSDDSFTSNLGRLVLSASRFEAILKRYIQTKSNDPKMDKVPMGGLLKKLKSSHYLGNTVDYHLSFILHQRNYFVHQLYDKLADYMLEETEIEQFRNRVKGIQDELDFFTNLFEEALQNQGTIVDD